MASASVPKNFDYIEISRNKFWDGGLLSNTPLRIAMISLSRDNIASDNLELVPH